MKFERNKVNVDVSGGRFVKHLTEINWTGFYMRNEEIMAEKTFEAFMVIRYGNTDSSTFHGSLDRNGRLISLSLKQFIYINSRSSSLHAEEHHAARHELKFADEIDMQIWHADMHGVASSHADAYYVDVIKTWTCYVDKFEHVARYTNEFEFNLQRVSIMYDFRLQANNIKLEAPAEKEEYECPAYGIL